MNKVLLDSKANVRLRAVLESLALTRAIARRDGKPVNRAIRERCWEIIKDPQYDLGVKEIAQHISRKTLCDHTLTVAISTYNEMANGEVEMVRDGELILIEGNQAPIG